MIVTPAGTPSEAQVLPLLPTPRAVREKTSKLSFSEASLRDSEIRYRRLFETAQDGILILDAKTGLITDVNPFLVKLLNYTHAEFLGKALWEIGLFKDIEASKETFRELQAKKYVRYEDLPLKTRGGESINVEFVSNVYRASGTNVIQCNIRDITVRKHAEQTAHQLQQSQKMEAVGQLAGGVAHDFNNLLGVILGYCEMLEARKDVAGTVRELIIEIHSAGSSAKELTRHLLAFSRRQVLLPVFLDLNVAVNRAKPMLNRMIGDDVEVVSILCPGIGTIKADSSQMEQVLMNLVVNARDAMPQGGKITIETANLEADAAYVRLHPSTPRGSYVLLNVGDTGIGMSEEVSSRIFEPFFSTKALGKGTGLGLSTVFDIVKQSGGVISVASVPGQGTTFSIRFPRVEEAAAGIHVIKSTHSFLGSETILLVDDAGPLRRLTRLLLEDSGYTVLDSGKPEDAILIASEYEGLLPLMITDIEMPVLSGPALAAKIALKRPETRVLFTSGYVEENLIRSTIPLRSFAFLEKPYTREELMKAVRGLLDLPSTIQ